MKPFLVTAVLAVLVAIPLMLRRKVCALAIGPGRREADEENRRYTIDDFLT